MSALYGAPSQPEGSETFSIATWNIYNRSNRGLESATRVLDRMVVNPVVLQETKVTDKIYANAHAEFKMLATEADNWYKGESRWFGKRGMPPSRWRRQRF